MFHGTAFLIIENFYRLIMIHLFQSALFQTNAAIIETEDLLLVVDPNWLPAEVENIRQHVENIRRNRPVFLLFTHSDYDHIIACKAFENVTTIASAAFVQNKDKNKVLKQIRQFDDSYYIRRDYPILYPAIDYVVEKDGQTLQVGNTELIFYLAPGHNPDGIIAYVQPGGYLVAGDYLCEVEFPYIYHSSTEYEATLDKFGLILQEKTISLLIPGHGTTTTDTDEIYQRLSTSRRYITDLRHHVLTGTDFDTAALLKQYRFPVIQRKFHVANIRLLQQELKNKKG
jgi:hydroxyacylglutathione hydrolase